MSEIQFAKAFLAALDGRPTKLPPDYVEDAKGYPARVPYILPRMPRPMQKTSHSKPAPGQERSITVAIKSLHRNPPLDVRLASLPLATTSLLDVRQTLAAQTHVPAAKLRLLHNKKPVTDTKVLKDLVGDEPASGSVLELGVMVVGGAATVAAAAAAASVAESAASRSPSVAAAAASEAEGSGQSVVEGEAFWTDLRKFLVDRIKDDKQADEVFSLFLRAWEERMP